LYFENVDISTIGDLFTKLEDTIRETKEEVLQSTRAIPHELMASDLKHLVLLADGHIHGMKWAIKKYREKEQLCNFIEGRYIAILAHALRDYVSPFMTVAEYLSVYGKDPSVKQLAKEPGRVSILKSLADQLEGIIVTGANQTRLRGIGHNYYSLVALQKLGHMVGHAKTLVRCAMRLDDTPSVLLNDVSVTLETLSRYMPKNVYNFTVPVEDRSFEQYFTSICNNVRTYRRQFDDLISKLLVFCEQEDLKDTTSCTKEGQKVEPGKVPSKKAIQAYLTLKAFGCSQERVAAIMTEQLKCEKPLTQGQISRWKDECETWLEANGLNVFPPEMIKKVTTMDPNILDMGARTDGRISGDPRHKAKADPDE
jgi:hypothetical protein